VVKVDKRIERDTLRRWRAVAPAAQVTEKLIDMHGTHLLRVAFPMKQDKAPDPVQVSFLRLVGVATITKVLPNLVSKAV
jgi:hypothetical protein